jgi:polysaccharide pyruvyl transferase WcaK-like protein
VIGLNYLADSERPVRLVVSSPDGLGDLSLREPMLSAFAKEPIPLLLLVRPPSRILAEMIAPCATILEIEIEPYSPFGIDESPLLPLWQAIQNWQPTDLLIAPTQRTVFDEFLIKRWGEGNVFGLDGGRYPAAVTAAQVEGVSPPANWPKVDPRMPELARNELLARQVLNRSIHLDPPRIAPREIDQARAKSILARFGFSVGDYRIACVGDCSRNAGRNWNSPDWANLLSHAVRRHGWKFLLVGSPSEVTTNRRIVDLMEVGNDQIALWSGSEKDLGTLIALLDGSAGYVGRDSGPMHLAAGLGRPVFAIFGGGTWPRFIPTYARGTAVTLEVPCQGCGWFCHLSRPFCIKDISFEPVRNLFDQFVHQPTKPLAVHEIPRSKELAVVMENDAAQQGREVIWQLHQWRHRQQIQATQRARPAEVSETSLAIHLGFHFYGTGNFGDDLMVDGFLGLLDQWHLGFRWTGAIAGDIGSQSRRFPQVRWMPATLAHRAQAIAEADVWLGLGSTPFQTDSGPWLLDYLSTEVDLCLRHDKPMFLLGVGVGDREALLDPRARKIVDAARMIWTRDDRSAELLSTIAHSDKIIAGADLAHLSLMRQVLSPHDATSIGWLLHFENSSLLDQEVLEGLLAEHGGRWLVQEVRELEGSERATLARLSAESRRAVDVHIPDYKQATSTRELIDAWPMPATLVSSRYHGLLVGAWAGSRVVAVERNEKLIGGALSLGCERLVSLRDRRLIEDALQKARIVPRPVLCRQAELAESACRHFLSFLADEPARRSLRVSRGSSEICFLPEEFNGEGWYEPENDGQQIYRWMGKSRAACLSLRHQSLARGGAFHCQIPHAIDPSALTGLRLFIDDREAPATVTAADRGWVLSFDLAPHQSELGVPIDVRLQIPQTRKPSEIHPGNPDDRTLGLAVGLVRFVPKVA